MQNMMDENQFDVDDPMDDLNRPVRLPFIKKGTLLYQFIYFEDSYLLLF
jgi:hypothetical protein